jgi:sialic acid synthase SpsE
MEPLKFKPEMQVGERLLGVGHPPYIIAEMACAHDGDIDKAKGLIDAAATAGVDAIQLQLFAVAHQVPPQHQLYNLLCSLEFSPDAWASLFSHARQRNLALFAFVYDTPSLNLALSLGIDGIKLSSADLSNPEMTEDAARSGLPITLGTGASTLDEISETLLQIQAFGGTQVVLMHGVQNFPTPIEHANLKRIQLLQRVFQMPVGYQDHTDAELEVSKVIDLAAIGMGACIIEKHITPSRAAQGTDYQAALEPGEWKQFVQHIRAVTQALGTDQITPLTEGDRRYRQFQKKSITAACDIPKGSVITRDQVIFLRSSESLGLAPKELPALVGRKTRREIKKFEQIQLDDVADES